jgi:histidine decarboxylase
MKDFKQAISPYEKYCDGFASPGASGKGYFVALAMGIGKTKLSLGHEGTSLLDAIDAFDKAEVEDVNIGQINMITVSSFCGIGGALWGYHAAKSKDLAKPHKNLPQGYVERNGQKVPVYTAEPLIDAARALFGTVDDKKFPLLPGGHVPCAGKSIKEVGPRHIYCGFGLGIAEDPETTANLMMEDLGDIPMHITGTDQEPGYKGKILANLAQSVLSIAENQKVRYKEIFVEMKDIVIQEGEMGCALVAAPYFTIAKNAVPSEGIENLAKMSLEEWSNSVIQKIYK